MSAKTSSFLAPPGSEAVTPEQIFAIRYDRLRQIVDARRINDLLDLSAILRQMLADKVRLIDAANRTFGLAIRFEVSTSTQDDNRERQAAGMSVLPVEAIKLDVWPGLPSNRLVTLDQFLKHTVIYRHGEHYSVLQVVKVCANKWGGVHLEAAGGDDLDERALRRLNDEIQLGGAPAVQRVLYAIGATTAKATQPLRDAIAVG